MQVISTNIGIPRRIEWKGRTEETGIFKSPVSSPIQLGCENVVGDAVADRRHHGGEYKACYLFASDHYGYWKERYPDLSWDWGMFGENLTVEGMDESTLTAGSIYSLGSALVQITIPREPCYKLGIRFGDQKIIEEFIDHGHPGTYVRVTRPGKVRQGDRLSLVEKADTSPSIAELYSLIYSKEKDRELLSLALNCPYIPERTREKLKKHQKKGA